MLFQLFEKLANVIDTIYDGISKIWRAFADGPLFYFTFYLLLVITGIIVIITAICEEV